MLLGIIGGIPLLPPRKCTTPDNAGGDDSHPARVPFYMLRGIMVPRYFYAQGMFYTLPSAWSERRTERKATKGNQMERRPDQQGPHRMAYEKNRRRVLSTQTVCGICGLPVDKSLRYPDPMSACVDHIIPIAKGGHPSDLTNLQLAHWACNRAKSDKLLRENKSKNADLDEIVSNRDLPLSQNWKEYRAK